MIVGLHPMLTAFKYRVLIFFLVLIKYIETYTICMCILRYEWRLIFINNNPLAILLGLLNNLLISVMYVSSVCWKRERERKWKEPCSTSSSNRTQIILLVGPPSIHLYVIAVQWVVLNVPCTWCSPCIKFRDLKIVK